MVGLAPYREDVVISDDSERLLYALGLRMLQCFTNRDRHVIRKALADLSVPPNLIHANDSEADAAVEPPNN